MEQPIIGQLSIDNHYVPEMYLRNWSADGNTVWMYRRLVSNKNVEWWKQQSIKSTAYLPHLYSHIEKGVLTDGFETWLNNEIETPAKTAIDNAITGCNLSCDELLALLRFTAAQMVRTPAYYVMNYDEWSRNIQDTMTRTVEEISNKLKTVHEQRQSLPLSQELYDDKFMPIKITKVCSANDDGALRLKIETIIGRSMWLSHIKRMATKNITYLERCKWHIIEAAPNVEWPTSDNPVIRLSYRSEKDYSFNGGIAQKNTEILFPLSPKHLLYTRVGCESSSEALQRNDWFSKLVWRIILEHGFLHIYSKARQKGMFKNCPRTISEVDFRRIHQQLMEWNDVNSAAEIDFF